jgi:hypothetical protein
MAEFEIGTTQVGMTNIESLATPVPLPQFDYLPFARVVNLGSGGTRGVGSPVATWTFGLLSIQEYNQLRTFCAGASAVVYIRTRVDDDTYDDFQAKMIWPNEGQGRWFGNRKNFVITFRNLVAV